MKSCLRFPRHLCWLLLAVVAGCASLEEALIFHPRRYPAGDWQPPVACEDAWIPTPDGLKLHGWFAAPGRPRAVVLYCHGNAGNITSRAGLLDMYPVLVDAAILVFDYRGYGKSEGAPSAAGVLADARAARRWLADRTGVAEADIVLVGNSLGGGVAVDLAAKDGAAGLVLENTFTSLPDVATHHLPLLPWQSLMGARLDSLALIGRYRGPLLQTHGEADGTIPCALGRRLFAAAHEPKTFVAVPGGGHNDPPTRPYLEALRQFFAGLPDGGARQSP